MKKLCVLVCSLLVIWAASCCLTKCDQSASAVEPDESPKPKPFVANPFCRACHLDFDDEEMAVNHERAGIGCERCHGESRAHRSDEANITPPEIMFPRNRINPTCMMCHPRGEIKDVVSHQVVLAAVEIDADAPAEPKKVCTDCHGTAHRMKSRDIRWNKATGELID